MKARVFALLVVFASHAFAAFPGAEMLADVILKDIDRDFDGKVDAAEWKEGTFDGFVEIDRNLDNVVVADEIGGLAEPLSEELGKFGASICVALIQKLLLTLDKDGDHRVSKVEYEEGAAVIFRRLDTDRDGVLTKAELLELPAKVISGGD